MILFNIIPNLLKISPLIFVFLIQLSFADAKYLSANDQEIIQSSITDAKLVTVIVGLTEAKDVDGLSSAAIKASKQRFLSSRSITNSQLDGSIEIIDELDNLPHVVIKINSKGLQALINHPQVQNIEANITFKPFLKTAVPRIMDINNPWSHPDYDGASSWVAVIDTGVNTAHPMFQGKSIIEACFVADNSCPNGTNTQYGSNAADPLGKSDHGTHVAGIAVGNYIPDRGFGGVAHNANLIAIQIFNRDGTANSYSLIRALNYVHQLSRSRMLSAVNLSFGEHILNYNRCETYNQGAVPSAVNILRNKKVATVASAGNDEFYGMEPPPLFFYFPPVYPACLDEVISVTSATKSYVIDRGAQRYVYLPSLIAPGKDILSASHGNNYTIKSGTSMSTAMISGAFAVLRTLDKSASVLSIEKALQNSGRIVKHIRYKSMLHHFWPLITKARSNVGGSTKEVTRIGFNIPSAIDRFSHANINNWQTLTSLFDGANGVAFTTTSNTLFSFLIYPQTLLTGRIAVKMKTDTDGDFGLIIQQAGSTSGRTPSLTSSVAILDDGYAFRIKNSGKIDIYAYEKRDRRYIHTESNSPFVNKHDWNTLLATTGGKNIKFYLNGNFIAQDHSKKLVYGAPGIYFRNTTFGENMTTYIDWFVTKSNSVSAGYR